MICVSLRITSCCVNNKTELIFLRYSIVSCLALRLHQPCLQVLMSHFGLDGTVWACLKIRSLANLIFMFCFELPHRIPEITIIAI